MKFHCTEPFIITLQLSRYDLNNVERGVKHQTVINKKNFSLSYRILDSENFMLSGCYFYIKISHNTDESFLNGIYRMKLNFIYIFIVCFYVIYSL